MYRETSHVIWTWGVFSVYGNAHNVVWIKGKTQILTFWMKEQR